MVRVLPSTADNALCVVAEEGCLPGEHGKIPSSSCADSRGGLFNYSESSTWKYFGNYSLVPESNLGYSNNATYGLDTVALGVSDATGTSQIDSQVISAFAGDDFYVGLVGLGHQPTNFSEYNTPNSSLLTSMRNNNMIPSLSWAYTAGAIYR